MTGNIANSIEQETKSCLVVITGIACFIPPAPDLSSFWQDRFHINGNQKFFQPPAAIEHHLLLFKLAKAALVDAGFDETTYVDKRISVVISANSKYNPADSLIKNSNLILAAELSSSLGFTKATKNLDLCAANPLESMKTAADQLQTNEIDLVLLVIADNHGDSDKSPCFGIFVLKRITEGISIKERIYASLSLLHQQTASHENMCAALKEVYKQKNILPSSIGQLTLSTQISEEVLDLTLVDFAKWFAEDRTESGNTSPLKNAWCAVRKFYPLDKHNSTSDLELLIETILSLQQRILLPITNVAISSTKMDLKQSPFYSNTIPRPWFHPQIHSQFHSQFSDLPSNIGSKANLRRAALHFVDRNGDVFHCVFEECPDLKEAKRRDLKPDWQSEVFTLYAEDQKKLLHLAESISEFLALNPNANLKDLAFTINSWTKGQIDQALTDAQFSPRMSSGITGQQVKVAFVSTSLEDLQNQLNKIVDNCVSKSFLIQNSENAAENIYWNSGFQISQEVARGKLAFILPGLGAAYPNMLVDMCLHFPEVRAIFDFVDYLAIASSNQLRPSDRIFPHQYSDGKLPIETPASLAVMDSAVVTVLMAEWAIFTLLLNLGITPDVLLGCSTGEFAALTMSGAVDIFSAAPVFYHLSTGIGTSLPIDRLINLRSLKINAAFEDIEQQLMHYQNKIHLSADLSTKQLIVTGNRESINFLAKSLEENKISADFLPFAIPYHTSLVSGIVPENNPEVQELRIDNPLIESWSCSLAQEYPASPSQIRKMTTELFSKPILFRTSIERLYHKGVRIFVEVGPRGNLAPVISETLQLQPHISLAANRADLSAITQLNHTLAALFVHDVYMDLSYLYQRRSPTLLPIFIDRTKSIPKECDIQSEQQTYREELSFAPGSSGISDSQLIDSFKNRLLQLENDVISVLKSETTRKVACAVLDTPEAKSRQDNYLSQEISLPQIFHHLNLNKSPFTQMACRLILEEGLPQDDLGLSKLAEHTLLPAENLVFQSFRQFAKRRQWLAGRIAIKEAVRDLLHNTHGAELSNVDIEISSLESGQIYVKKVKNNYQCPPISLSHKDGKVIAIAADSASYSAIGIDLESTHLTDESLVEFILSSEERNSIEYLQPTNKFDLKKIWAAKEAAGKALGLGLPDCFKKTKIVKCNEDMSEFGVKAIENQEDYSCELTVSVSEFNGQVVALATLSV